jgi:hypothetical protein
LRTASGDVVVRYYLGSSSGEIPHEVRGQAQPESGASSRPPTGSLPPWIKDGEARVALRPDEITEYRGRLMRLKSEAELLSEIKGCASCRYAGDFHCEHPLNMDLTPDVIAGGADVSYRFSKERMRSDGACGVNGLLHEKAPVAEKLVRTLRTKLPRLRVVLGWAVIIGMLSLLVLSRGRLLLLALVAIPLAVIFLVGDDE